MKRLNLFVPILAAVTALFAGTASAAAEKEAQLKAFYEANAKQTELLEKILAKIDK